MQSDKTPKAIEKAIADSDKTVRVGVELMDQLDMDKSLKVNLLIDIIEKRTTEEKQAALNALGKVPAEFSKAGFSRLLGPNGSRKIEPRNFIGVEMRRLKKAEILKSSIISAGIRKALERGCTWHPIRAV
jgi:hypothetical protein